MVDSESIAMTASQEGLDAIRAFADNWSSTVMSSLSRVSLYWWTQPVSLEDIPRFRMQEQCLQTLLATCAAVRGECGDIIIQGVMDLWPSIRSFSISFFDAFVRADLEVSLRGAGIITSLQTIYGLFMILPSQTFMKSLAAPDFSVPLVMVWMRMAERREFQEAEVPKLAPFLYFSHTIVLHLSEWDVEGPAIAILKTFPPSGAVSLLSFVISKCDDRLLSEVICAQIGFLAVTFLHMSDCTRRALLSHRCMYWMTMLLKRLAYLHIHSVETGDSSTSGSISGNLHYVLGVLHFGIRESPRWLEEALRAGVLYSLGNLSRSDSSHDVQHDISLIVQDIIRACVLPSILRQVKISLKRQRLHFRDMNESEWDALDVDLLSSWIGLNTEVERIMKLHVACQLDTRSLQQCVLPSCKSLASKLCSRCGVAMYCSPACQRIHYPFHRDECRADALKIAEGRPMLLTATDWRLSYFERIAIAEMIGMWDRGEHASAMHRQLADHPGTEENDWAWRVNYVVAQPRQYMLQRAMCKEENPDAAALEVNWMMPLPWQDCPCTFGVMLLSPWPPSPERMFIRRLMAEGLNVNP